VENIADYKEIVEVIKEQGGDAFKRCFQCGLCDTVCPWNKVITFSMRKIVREATFGMTDIEAEDIWRCTSCGKCPQRCPRDVRQIDSVIALRRVATEYMAFPSAVQPIRSIRASLLAEGNPLNEKREDRAAWAEGLGVKPFEQDMEILYFPGCYPSYDPRLKKVARATVEILKKAGVSFGILGKEENCCGESIRKTGDEEMFISLAKANIKTFIDHGVKRILVSSPHCYHTFKNEYPEFMVHFEIVHITQFLFELIEAGRLKIDGKFAKKITYHDPCYLGRHNGIYDEPREVLSRIDGLELVEMAETREDALCCGGGAGRIWMEVPKGERFSDIRLKQAVDAGAEELVTACPYCITNFEDSRITMEYDDVLKIKDITEVILEAIKETEETGEVNA